MRHESGANVWLVLIPMAVFIAVGVTACGVLGMYVQEWRRFQRDKPPVESILREIREDVTGVEEHERQ